MRYSIPFASIAEELRYQYRLSYYPANSKQDGAFRAIKVRVEKPDLIVRARAGYKARGAAQASSGQDDAARPEMKRKRNLAVN